MLRLLLAASLFLSIFLQQNSAFAQLSPGSVIDLFVRPGGIIDNLSRPPFSGVQPKLSDRPSFGCGGASSAVARILCTDANGPKADWDLNATLWATDGQLSPEQRKLFEIEQAQWRASVDINCGLARNVARFSEGQISCVLKMFRQRTSTLRAQLSGDLLSESQLSPEERAQAQKALKERGFFAGTLDGQFGSATRDAIRNFQRSEMAAITGILTSDQRNKLIAIGSNNTNPDTKPQVQQQRGSGGLFGQLSSFPPVCVSLLEHEARPRTNSLEPFSRQNAQLEQCRLTIECRHALAAQTKAIVDYLGSNPSVADAVWERRKPQSNDNGLGSKNIRETLSRLPTNIGNCIQERLNIRAYWLDKIGGSTYGSRPFEAWIIASQSLVNDLRKQFQSDEEDYRKTTAIGGLYDGISKLEEVFLSYSKAALSDDTAETLRLRPAFVIELKKVKERGLIIESGGQLLRDIADVDLKLTPQLKDRVQQFSNLRAEFLRTERTGGNPDRVQYANALREGTNLFLEIQAQLKKAQADAKEIKLLVDNFQKLQSTIQERDPRFVDASTASSIANLNANLANLKSSNLPLDSALEITLLDLRGRLSILQRSIAEIMDRGEADVREQSKQRQIYTLYLAAVMGAACLIGVLIYLLRSIRHSQDDFVGAMPIGSATTYDHETSNGLIEVGLPSKSSTKHDVDLQETRCFVLVNDILNDDVLLRYVRPGAVPYYRRVFGALIAQQQIGGLPLHDLPEDISARMLSAQLTSRNFSRNLRPFGRQRLWNWAAFFFIWAWAHYNKISYRWLLTLFALGPALLFFAAEEVFDSSPTLTFIERLFPSLNLVIGGFFAMFGNVLFLSKILSDLRNEQSTLAPPKISGLENDIPRLGDLRSKKHDLSHLPVAGLVKPVDVRFNPEVTRERLPIDEDKPTGISALAKELVILFCFLAVIVGGLLFYRPEYFSRHIPDIFEPLHSSPRFKAWTTTNGYDHYIKIQLRDKGPVTINKILVNDKEGCVLWGSPPPIVANMGDEIVGLLFLCRPVNVQIITDRGRSVLEFD